MEILIFFALLGVGYTSGRYFEKRHFKSLMEREKEFIHIPVVTGEWEEQLPEDCDYKMYGAGVVIASDYFKSVAAGLINLVGGRVTVYENLLDRGRREAILRMKEKAARWGAKEIVNMRFETAMIGGPKLACMEIFAYGTALKPKQDEVSSEAAS